jgi:hypothetical protein
MRAMFQPFFAIIPLMTLFIGLSLNAMAQEPDRRGTIEFINQMLSPDTYVDLDQGTLFAEFRDSTGQVIRKDRVEIPDFGEVIEFEYESGLLCIPCSKYIPGCVTRELVLQKVRRGYDRFSIPLSGPEEYEPLRKAFDHLFKILTVGGYRETVIFN